MKISATTTKDDDQIADGTVGKALRVLDIIESFQRPVRFTEIQKNSPFPKPSTFRLIKTLLKLDMLSFDNNGYYSLGSRLIRLAHSAWSNASIAPIAAPVLDELIAKTQHTAHLAKFDNGQVLYLDKRDCMRPLQLFSNAGKVAPAYCTGIGKSMLAFCDSEKQANIVAKQSFYPHTLNSHRTPASLYAELAQIKVDGYALDREEHEKSIICIAVPILNNTDDVIGGVSLTDSTDRTSLDELKKSLSPLQEAAKCIGEKASAWMLHKQGE